MHHCTDNRLIPIIKSTVVRQLAKFEFIKSNKYRMMTRLLCYCLCILACLSAGAATPGLSAAKCFTEAPARLLPLLPSATRLDMLDYFHAGSVKTSRNSTDGAARIIDESDYSLKFQISEGITGQFFVLNPMDECPLIGYIETVSLPAADSSVKVFNCRWQPVSVLEMPELSAWVNPGGGSVLPELEDTLPFMFVTAEYVPRDAELILTNNTRAYFPASDVPECLSAMRTEIILHWTGKRFKK